jgi:transposase
MHFPRRSKTVPLADCGGGLHVLGKEVVRREIKLVPAKAVIVEHVRHAYGCRECEQCGTSSTVIKAPVNEPVIGDFIVDSFLGTSGRNQNDRFDAVLPPMGDTGAK